MIEIEEEEGRQGEWEACRWGDRGRRVDMSKRTGMRGTRKQVNGG